MGFPLTKDQHDAIEAQIARMPELIVAVAVREPDGLILTMPRPARHGDVGPQRGEHGFLTSHGRFVDRAEGARIALAQTPDTHIEGQLFTEDLWNDPGRHHDDETAERWRAHRLSRRTQEPLHDQ